MKALEWLKRGISAESPIDSLTDFWRAFNNQFSKAGGESERKKINSHLARVLTEEMADRLLQRFAAEVDYLMSRPVVDMRENGKTTENNIAAFRKSKEALPKVLEVFQVIYQVRCNLEHGQKAPNRTRDLRLCECSAPLVADVVAKALQQV